jgi:hypothetical protein
MLSQVLHEIKNVKEPITLAELSQRLGIERSALEAMLAYWVRKGRLQAGDTPLDAAQQACAGGSCGAACSGPADCAFIAKMPKTFSLSQQDKKQ